MTMRVEDTNKQAEEIKKKERELCCLKTSKAKKMREGMGRYNILREIGREMSKWKSK